MNIQSQHPSLAPFLSSAGAKQLLPNHIAADPLWPSPFILICKKPLWTSHLLPVPSKIWQMSQNLCVCLRPVCENLALSNPWNCETWTNIPVPKQHKWNNKKMNVRQSHRQTLQTKLKKKSLSHQIFRFKQKFYCALASLVQKHEEDTWYLDSSPCFYPADDANSDDTEYLSPHLRRLYPYTWHFDMGTPPIMGDTNHFIRDALYVHLISCNF